MYYLDVFAMYLLYLVEIRQDRVQVMPASSTERINAASFQGKANALLQKISNSPGKSALVSPAWCRFPVQCSIILPFTAFQGFHFS
jgi:hypothetical protein